MIFRNSEPFEVKCYSENWNYRKKNPEPLASPLPNFTLRILTAKFIPSKQETERGFL